MVFSEEKKMEEIRRYTNGACGIAWDTCHKVYIVMDEEQMRVFGEYEYDPLIGKDEMNGEEMAACVAEWYRWSCPLRFISAVATNTEDPNAGFTQIIEQFEDGGDYYE